MLYIILSKKLTFPLPILLLLKRVLNTSNTYIKVEDLYKLFLF